MSRRRRLGTGHVVRLLMLVVIVLGLTWYSRQGRNNPFAREPYIEIGANAGWCFLRCATRNAPDARESIVLLHRLAADTVSRYGPSPRTWTLFTYGIPAGLDAYFTVPPVAWFVFDPPDETGTAPGASGDDWPRPVPAGRQVTAGGADFSRVAAFGIPGQIASVDFAALKAAIVTAADFPPDSIKGSSFKETFDIVVCVGTTARQTRHIRNLLRPKHVIVLPPDQSPSGRTKRMENILRPSRAPFAYVFSRNAREKIRMERGPKKCCTGTGGNTGWSAK
ncbi:MAG: hypothetical protein GF418_02535 [Chitinivibrionales bacterium]|nr:hypothetical protein [Chitinivibrionales bacterium]MBD3394479.1 hypothetical protein [Chitinivibrionales bacterium]